MGIVYDRERDDFLDRMKKTYVKHTLFQLSDLNRPIIESIAKKEKENGVSAVEWYKDSPVLLDDVEYNASLTSIGHGFDVEPNEKEDEAILNALKEVPQAKPGEKGFGVRIDIVSPFVRKNFLHYFLK